MATSRLNRSDAPNPKPHYLNAPGDFYVIQDECMGCTLPASEAPDLIGTEDPEAGSTKYHCHFKKQPITDDEAERAGHAMLVSCTGALCYRGSDPKVIRKLEAVGAEIDLKVKARAALRSVSSSGRKWWKFWRKD